MLDLCLGEENSFAKEYLAICIVLLAAQLIEAMESLKQTTESSVGERFTIENVEERYVRHV